MTLKVSYKTYVFICKIKQLKIGLVVEPLASRKGMVAKSVFVVNEILTDKQKLLLFTFLLTTKLTLQVTLNKMVAILNKIKWPL